MNMLKDNLTAEQLFQLAISENLVKRYEKATRLYRKAFLKAKAKGLHKLSLQTLLHNAWASFFAGHCSKSTKLINEARNYADKCAPLKARLSAYLDIADFHYHVMKYEDANGSLEAVLAVLRVDKYPDIEARALGLIAKFKKNRGRYNISNYYLKKQSELWKKLKNNSELCTTMIEISKNYASMGDFDNALLFLETAHKTARKHGDHLSRAESLFLQIEVHRIIGDSKSVALCSKELSELYRKHDVLFRNVDYRIYGCKMPLALREYDKALELSLRLYEEFDRQKIARNIFKAEVMLIIGQAYLGKNDFQKARDWFWKCIEYLYPHFSPNTHILFRAIDSLAIATYNLTNGAEGPELLDRVASARSRLNDYFYRRHYDKKDEEMLNWQIEELLSRCKDGKMVIFRKGIIAVNLKSGEVFKNDAERVAVLSDKQRKVLRLLVKNRGAIVSKADIVKAAGYSPKEQYVSGLTRYYISQIRKKIEYGESKIIITDGGGYTIP